MDNKAKAIWYFSIFISVIVIITISIQNYNASTKLNKLIAEFNSEQIGVDEKLENKVEKIEKSVESRQEYEFLVKEDPTDLSLVIVFDGYDSRYSASSNYILVTAIIGSKQKNKYRAIVRQREKLFTVQVGDSVGGGLITNITDKEVSFSKDNIVYDITCLIFSFGISSLIKIKVQVNPLAAPKAVIKRPINNEK